MMGLWELADVVVPLSSVVIQVLACRIYKFFWHCCVFMNAWKIYDSAYVVQVNEVGHVRTYSKRQCNVSSRTRKVRGVWHSQSF